MPIKRLEGIKKTALKIAIYEGIRCSRTAHSLWTWLDKDGEGRDFDLIVLGTGQNFGQMLTEKDQSGDDALRARTVYFEKFEDNEIVRPVVLWNPSFEFDYFGDVKGVDVSNSGDIVPRPTSKSGGYYYQYPLGSFGSTKARIVRVTKGKMPAWIVLFHELGHVKQYFDGGGLTEWAERLKDTNAIEAENLSKHENPMCVETGRPIRAHYKHSTHGFHDLVQRYSRGKKVNAWKAADDAAGRKTIERDLKTAAQLRGPTPPAAGVFPCA